MKKRLSVILPLFMATALSACSSGTTTTPTKNTETTSTPPTEGAETRTGRGKGFGGTITAEVTRSEGVITSVIFEGDNETPTIGGAALETLAQQIVEKMEWILMVLAALPILQTDVKLPF